MRQVSIEWPVPIKTWPDWEDDERAVQQWAEECERELDSNGTCTTLEELSGLSKAELYFCEGIFIGMAKGIENITPKIKISYADYSLEQNSESLTITKNGIPFGSIDPDIPSYAAPTAGKGVYKRLRIFEYERS